MAPIVVLHVDDDPDVLDLATTFLEGESNQLRLRTATSGEDALSVLHENDIDCVVSDYEMSDTTGIALLESVREKFLDLPFILFTSTGSEAIASRAISAGVTDYLQKEISTDQYAVLANRIENAVRSARTERALQESEERYRTVVEGSHDAIYIYQDDRFAFVNERACEITSYTADELRGMDVWSLLHSDDHERVQAIAENRMNGTHDVSTYDARLTKDDEVRFRNFSVHATQYRGMPTTIGSVRDVTERKNREVTLEALHNATRTLMQAETSAEVSEIAARVARDVLDLPLTAIWDCEDSMPELVARTEQHRTAYGETVPEADRKAVADAFEASETVVRTRYRDGAESEALVPLGARGVMAFGAKRLDDFYVYYAQLLAANTAAALDRAEREDERKAYQRELERQNERLEEFASVVSHDLRNPLNVAQGYLDMYRSTEETEHLTRVEHAHDRMANIVKDVLTLARQGRSVSETELVSGRAVTMNAWASVETGPATLDASWKSVIDADASRLQQLFENLFRNAIDHGQPDVTIRVGTLPGIVGNDGLREKSATESTPVGFFVEDDGPGIPEAARKTVFESGYSTGKSGTGLGLTIVRQIAEAHGWTISLAEAEIGGARFEFTGVELATE